MNTDKEIFIDLKEEKDIKCVYNELEENKESTICNLNSKTHDINFDDDRRHNIQIISTDILVPIMDDEEKEEEYKCPGCDPIFQPNQLGHIGPCGCLGEYLYF